MLPYNGSVRIKGAASGSYGPNNPPPPPSSPPPPDRQSQRSSDESIGQSKKGRNRPTKNQRLRAYAKVEAEQTREKDDRSLSPDRSNQRPDSYRFRERSPLRRERRDQLVHVQPSSRDQKQMDHEAVRCYACNELGEWPMQMRHFLSLTVD